jgi:mannose-6-phosphate isomerase-like protein (cupin superfamily)
MENFNEKDREFRGGDFGPKYLVKGPHWDGGIIQLKPGQTLGAHYHNQVEETFYFLEGMGDMVVNGAKYPIKPGEVFIIQPGEQHDIVNNGGRNIRVFFVKSPYLPEDRVAG